MNFVQVAVSLLRYAKFVGSSWIFWGDESDDSGLLPKEFGEGMIEIEEE